MKTIGRILLILVVFSIFAGLTVTVVNASGASATTVSGTRQFRPDGSGNGIRTERDGGREAGGGSGWMFGLLKNVSVMALLVTVIVWPRNIAKKKKRSAGINSINNQA